MKEVSKNKDNKVKTKTSSTNKQGPRRLAEKKKGKETLEKKKKIIRYSLMGILGVIIVICSVKIVLWVIENKNSNNTLEKANNSVHIVENAGEYDKKYTVDFNELKNINTDVVAWVKVENTNIKYPVVKGNDREYYLTHSLDNSSNSAGWIFMDPNDNLDGTDKNIILYGHNRKDLSMFGTLSNTLEDEWLNNEKNRTITFITEKGYYEAKIYSVYTIKDESYYISTSFSDYTFEDFISRTKARSDRDFGVEVNKDDTILTLSTCANDNRYRVVVHAKLVKVE